MQVLLEDDFLGRGEHVEDLRTAGAIGLSIIVQFWPNFCRWILNILLQTGVYSLGAALHATARFCTTRHAESRQLLNTSWKQTQNCACIIHRRCQRWKGAFVCSFRAPPFLQIFRSAVNCQRWRRKKKEVKGQRKLKQGSFRDRQGYEYTASVPQ